MTQLMPARDTADWSRPSTLTAGEALYDEVAGAAAGLVISAYSSSFGLASRLLHRPARDHIRNVYALVRLADEIVDGPMALTRPARARDLLDRLEDETLEALDDGYSTNLIVHAFASTARRCHIEADQITPFFASMRTDLTVLRHDDASFVDYVYGSAEVVGLMCLRVFVAPGHAQAADPAPSATYDELAPGARRLGSAFQKVNFLRDIAADYHERGRSYFPDIEPTKLSERDKNVLLDDIDSDLEAAWGAIRALPDNSRAAVGVAHAVFDELSARLRQTPVSAIMRRRVRLSAATKTRVVASVLVAGRRGR